MADYLPQNREELNRWLRGESDFDWTSVLKIIALREGIDWVNIDQLERRAKAKVINASFIFLFK